MKRILDRSTLINIIVSTSFIVISSANVVACSDAESPPPAADDKNPIGLPQQDASSSNPTPPGSQDAAASTNDQLAPPSTTSCRLDTRAFLVVANKPVETITRDGRLYNFESNGAAWQINGVDLTDIAGYQSGPCRGRARGQCTFDTRTFVPVKDTLVESVTAYGSYWTFDAKGQASSFDLALMPRYQAGGPCEGRAPGTCKLDTRTFIASGVDFIESITAYGKSFSYMLDGTPLPGNGADLTSVARYAAGPCAGKTTGQCTFETRLLEDMDGHVLETITAYGKVFHYEANGAAAFAEVQPSNIAVEKIEPWASGVCTKKP